MAKTAAFGVMHLGIAFSVTYGLTGNLAVAGAVTFVEPMVNMVAHYFFDKHWPSLEARGQAWIAGRRGAMHSEMRQVAAIHGQGVSRHVAGGV